MSFDSASASNILHTPDGALILASSVSSLSLPKLDLKAGNAYFGNKATTFQMMSRILSPCFIYAISNVIFSSQR